MSIFAGGIPEELRPTDRQADYAETLIEHLYERDQANAYDYQRWIESCTLREEMSELIDEMKEKPGYD